MLHDEFPIPHDSSIIPTSSTYPSPASSRKPVTMDMKGFLALVVVSFLFCGVEGSPLYNNVSKSRDLNIIRRADNNNSPSPKLWVPVVVVVLAVGFLGLLAWSKRSNISPWSRNSTTQSTNAAGSAGREITAEQLAGTINNNANGNTPAPPRARRNRRPRRTPSQISTTSLPEYQKEPGENELVIFRGQQDMEDVPMPTALVMPSVEEDEENENPAHSRDHSQASRYSPMPTTPNNIPLLQGDHSSILSSDQHLLPPGDGMPRRSTDSMHSSEESSSLMRINSNVSAQNQEPDPRGEAPAYFEVVDLSSAQDSSLQLNTSSTDETQSGVSRPIASPTPPSAPEHATARQTRSSGIRNFLHRISVAGSIHGGSQHTRGQSSHSVLTTTTTHSRETTASRASHRPSHSGSGSVLTSSVFRSISRQKSTHTLNSTHLNSPSLISLNSISAPLTHTAIRTEFTYPKSGPTPEQLKLISSRESFARFGMPYGPDAIAFASSNSRLDLQAPPPDFDAAASDLHLPRSAGPSRLRSASNATDLQRESSETDEVSDDAPQVHRSVSPSSLRSRALAPTPSISIQAREPANIPLPSSPTDPDTASTPTERTPTSSAPMMSFSLPMQTLQTNSHPSSKSLRTESRTSSYSVQSFATAEETLDTPLVSQIDLSSTVS